MKKIALGLLSTLISLPVIASTQELPNYSEILNAVENGKKITIVVNFTNCSSDIKNIKGLGYYSPQSIMLHNNKITFSDKHFTTHNPLYENKAVLEYVKYNINEDSVDLTTEFVNPVNYQQITELKPITIKCSIGNNQANFFAN